MQVDRNGQIDVGGLSPGLYRVNLRGPGGQQSPSFVRVSGTASRSLDLSAAIPVCELTLHFENRGPGSIDNTRIQVVFHDLETGATFTSYGQGGLQRRPEAGTDEKHGGDRTLDVLPGRYRVVMNGNSDGYLVAVSGKGTNSAGRVLTVSGSTAVTLTVAEGRATVRGLAMEEGSPREGAMVLLIPAAYGQAGSLQMLRRDQTNTDGSFELANVIPGNYILLAIDSWTVNWHDPATLASYLVHGVPLSLAPGATAKQDLVALKP